MQLLGGLDWPDETVGTLYNFNGPFMQCFSTAIQVLHPNFGEGQASLVIAECQWQPVANKNNDDLDGNEVRISTLLFLPNFAK